MKCKALSGDIDHSFTRLPCILSVGELQGPFIIEIDRKGCRSRLHGGVKVVVVVARQERFSPVVSELHTKNREN